MNPFTSGQMVRLNTPENHLAHGQHGRVKEQKDWGAVIETQFGSREFRATFDELEIVEEVGHVSAVVKPKEQGYTGNFCDFCGSCRMLRVGSCQTCQDCGASSGCGS